MPPLAIERTPHPCLDRGCGHPDTDHLPTPELATRDELVVWCRACRRHEVYRPRTWWGLGRAGRTPRKVADFTRPT